MLASMLDALASKFYAAFAPLRGKNAEGGERIYHYHVQKTGGTSLNYMFLALGGENPEVVYERLHRRGTRGGVTTSGELTFVGWDPRLIQRGRYFYGFSHTPKYRLRLPEPTITVTCLRDACRRVLSLYKEFLEYKVHDVAHPCRVYSDRWIGGSFSDFLRNVPREELLQQLFMFSPCLDVDEAADAIADCSFVLRTEDLAAGIAVLSQRIGMTLAPIHTRRTSIEIDLTPAEERALRDILEPEYRLLEKVRFTARSPDGAFAAVVSRA
jgi:hypothetical protein